MAFALKNADLFAETNSAAKPFKMLLAPRIGMDFFRNLATKDPFKRLEFFKVQGFRAVEGLVFVQHKKPYTAKQKETHKLLGQKAKALGFIMGPQSSMNEKDFPTMTAFKTPDGKSGKTALRDMLKRQLDTTFEVLSNVGGKTFIIGAGAQDNELPDEIQFANVVENMAFCAEICQKAGFVMEIEPLNTQSHKGIYCNTATLGAEICEQVNMKSCRLLFDVFHEQMQTGNLNSIDNPLVYKHIESFHIADAPTRQEPGTGVIDYAKFFEKIWNKGFRGVLGLEHKQSANTVECEMQMLKTYRAFDAKI